MQDLYLAPAHFDVVTVSGPGAKTFLQGQLTCDLESLAPSTSTRGAACNNKGRVFATFVLLFFADTYHLVLQRGLGAVFASALKKYLPFYKCSMGPPPAAPDCHGLAGPAAATCLAALYGVLPTQSTCLATPQGWLCTLDQARQQFLWFGAAADMPEELRSVATAFAQGPEAWLRLELQTGHFPFTTEDVEKFTPQELQLDQHGYVSFDKGCYTGQEIVARMHYRGKAKKRLYLLQLSVPEQREPAGGVAIVDGSGKPAGNSIKELPEAKGRILALVPLAPETAAGPLAPAGQGSHIIDLQPF